MQKETFTAPRKKVLDFIRHSLEAGTPPSHKDIQLHCKFKSPHAVTYHISRLVREGFIKVREGLARGITLTEKTLGIPILGRVPAGPPHEALENIDGYVKSIPVWQVGYKLFALRVKGDSMINAHIAEGDIVIVRSTSEVKNGDIVVARLHNDEATIKEFYQRGAHAELRPANPRYTPIPMTDDVEIVGKIVRVQRDYR